MHEDPKVFLRVNPHSKQPWLEIKSVWISALAALDSHNVGILAGWHSGQEKTRGKLSDQTVWRIKNKHAETSQMPLGKKTHQIKPWADEADAFRRLPNGKESDSRNVAWSCCSKAWLNLEIFQN